ncbi:MULTISPECIES: DUF2115 domain-containing protein [Methanocalculus]|uniref:DUF2115 domain-containing protein n=1 Tax=Methanocalculus TaxID=71151 RepID=UPI00209E86C4|nr:MULTISPECIES: DUF2115 domain-containing protein [unclassified Methanocalculus]MCP1662044.1 uncharacterized protein (UPF0305 family) [Methanocalculus sp. AMF5]
MTNRVSATLDEAEDEISRIVLELGRQQTKSGLAGFIASEIRRYTPRDLMEIAAALRREIQSLPAHYQEGYGASVHEQIFGTHHRILLMERNGALEELPGEIPDPDLFQTFCRMVQQACLLPHHTDDAHMTPMGRLLYYLLSCFLIFVLEEPAHPIGTPFPGGFRVQLRGGVVCCPVKEKEGDVPYALCRFCPSKQA